MVSTAGICCCCWSVSMLGYFWTTLQRPRCRRAGSVGDYRVVPSLICPARRLTYHEVDAALGEQPDAVGHAEDQAALLALQQVLCPVAAATAWQ